MGQIWRWGGLGLLVGCATLDPEEEPRDLPLGWEEVDRGAQREGPDFAGLTFTQGALVPGTSVPFTVTGAAPNDTIQFLFSTDGTGMGPCIAQLGGLCVDILAPLTLLGSAVADNVGTATLDVTIPNGAPQIFIFTQAVVDRGMNGSVATNTITAPILGGHLDLDGDGYCGGPTCADPALLTDDCADDDPIVNPGATVPRDVPYWNGVDFSFDYNCDGVETLTFDSMNAFECMADGGNPFSCPNNEGWQFGDVPGCGDLGNWASGCIDFSGLFCFASNVDVISQTCL